MKFKREDLESESKDPKLEGKNHGTNKVFDKGNQSTQAEEKSLSVQAKLVALSVIIIFIMVLVFLISRHNDEEQ